MIKRLFTAILSGFIANVIWCAWLYFNVSLLAWNYHANTWSDKQAILYQLGGIFIGAFIWIITIIHTSSINIKINHT